jgi:AraC-like DNA-binding protein
VPSPLRIGTLAPPPAAGPGGQPTAYVEKAPPAHLTEVVAGSWLGRAGWERRLRVLPDGCTELVWNGRRLWVVGAIRSAVWEPVSPAAESVGIRLRPGVAGMVLGCPASELPGRLTAVETLWGPAAGLWEEKLAHAPTAAARRVLLEDLVGRRLAGREPDQVTLAAAALAASSANVDAIADGVSLSSRQLRRRFHEQVGYGPKTLHRVLRFQRFVRRLPALAGGSSLAVAAAETGYADQSHLGRECQELAGSSPRSLVRRWAAQREVGRNLPDR